MGFFTSFVKNSEIKLDNYFFSVALLKGKCHGVFDLFC